jgi:hypothetical protein
MTIITSCEHEWHFIRVITEDMRKKDNIMKSVFITKWVCSRCGQPKILEYYE